MACAPTYKYINNIPTTGNNIKHNKYKSAITSQTSTHEKKKEYDRSIEEDNKNAYYFL